MKFSEVPSLAGIVELIEGLSLEIDAERRAAADERRTADAFRDELRDVSRSAADARASAAVAIRRLEAKITSQAGLI